MSQNTSSSNSLRPPPNTTRPRKGGKPASVGSSSSLHPAEYDDDHSQRGKRGLSPVKELSAAARQKSPFLISLREANTSGSNYQSMSALLVDQQQQQWHIEQPSRQSLDDTQIESRDYESEGDISTDLKQNALRKATKPRSRQSLPMVSAEKRRKSKGSGRKSGARKTVDEISGSEASHSPSRNPSPRDQDDDEPSVEYQDDPSVVDLTNDIPPPDLPDNWDQFVSQFTSMQAEIAALSNHIQRVDDASIAKSFTRSPTSYCPCPRHQCW